MHSASSQNDHGFTHCDSKLFCSGCYSGESPGDLPSKVLATLLLQIKLYRYSWHAAVIVDEPLGISEDKRVFATLLLQDMSLMTAAQKCHS